MLICFALVSCRTAETTDGMAIADIRLGESTASDVERCHGPPDSVEHHGEYSAEMVYAQRGLSFYYRKDDEHKSIFSIAVTPPYQLRTVEGIGLDSSTMEDVRKAYGDLNWKTTNGSDYWFSEHDGIEYGVLREKSVPQYPLNERLHMTRKIIRIDIDNRYRTQQVEAPDAE